jgi:hypothetical protein
MPSKYGVYRGSPYLSSTVMEPESAGAADGDSVAAAVGAAEAAEAAADAAVLGTADAAAADGLAVEPPQALTRMAVVATSPASRFKRETGRPIVFMGSAPPPG